MKPNSDVQQQQLQRVEPRRRASTPVNKYELMKWYATSAEFWSEYTGSDVVELHTNLFT